MVQGMPSGQPGDDQHAMLRIGEYVVRQPQAQIPENRALLDAINYGVGPVGRAAGGVIGGVHAKLKIPKTGAPVRYGSGGSSGDTTSLADDGDRMLCGEFTAGKSVAEIAAEHAMRPSTVRESFAPLSRRRSSAWRRDRLRHRRRQRRHSRPGALRQSAAVRVPAGDGARFRAAGAETEIQPGSHDAARRH